MPSPSEPWDRSVGTNGSQQDAGTTGGTSAFSTASETADITITAVNDLPVTDLNGSDGAGINYSATFSEGDSPVNIADSDATITDVDSTTYNGIGINLGGFTDGSSEHVFVNGVQFQFGVSDSQTTTVGSTLFEVDSDGTGFTITRSGGGVIPQAHLQALLRTVTYENISSTPTAGNRTFTIAAEDAGLGNATPASVSTISVSPVNNAPVISDVFSGQSASEGSGNAAFSSETITDVDSPDFDGGTLSFTVSSTPNAANDTLQIRNVNGVAVTGTDVYVDAVLVGTIAGQNSSGPLTVSFNSDATVARTDKVLKAFAILNLSDDPTTGIRTVDAVLTDGDGGTSSPSSKDINFTATNDAPSGADNTVNTLRDQDYTFSTIDFGFSDVESDLFSAVQLTSLPGTGTLYFDFNMDGSYDVGEEYTGTPSIAVSTIINSQLKFMPVAGESGTAYTSFNFAVQDNGGVANGGVDTDQSPNTMTIDVDDAYRIEGNIVEDINGDASLVDAAGLDGVTVYLYEDTNTDSVASAGDLLVSTQTTAGGGFYSFQGLQNATYFVVVDSRTIVPTAGLNGGSLGTDIWAEQTYGVAGAMVTDGLGGTTVLAGSGAAFGGKTSGVSDDASSLLTAEHVTSVTVNNGDVVNIDSGFSLNVVTHVNDADDVGGEGRSSQGSLRQFIDNANAIAGVNAMRFAPTAATNATDGGTGNWWSVTLSSDLSAITDANTTIDGTAFDFTDGTTVLNTNTGDVNVSRTVGVDGLTLDAVEKQELEINAAGFDTAITIDANSVAVSDVAVYGALRNGGVGGKQIEVTSNVTSAGAASINRAVVGARADGTDPGAVNRGDFGFYLDGAANVFNNFVAYMNFGGVRFNGAASGNTDVVNFTNNEVSFSGFTHNAGDLITIDGENAVVSGNYVHDAQHAGAIQAYNGKGIELWSTAISNLVENNTVEAAQTAGIGIGGGAHDNVISKNVVTGTLGDGSANSGAGILITPVTSNTYNNTITQNSTYDNAGLGIDLDVRTAAASALGDGATANDGVLTPTAPNELMDSPVVQTANLVGTNLTLAGYVGSAAGQTAFAGATVEFFVSNSGEGQTYLGTLTADGSGNFSGTLVVSGVVDTDEIVATATNGTGSTSEFGSAFAINATPTAITPNSFNLAENTDTTGGLLLANLATTDPDTGDSFTYAFAGGPDGIRFYLSGGNQLHLNDGVLDFETKSSYSVDIRTTDSSGLSHVETIVVSVDPVSEAPVVTVPATQSVNEDTSISISGLSVADDDGDLASVALSAGSGSLRILLQGAASITAGANDSAAVTVSGTQADINATLATLAYIGNGDYNGTDTINVLATDGSALTHSDSFDVVVAPVNDAPVLTATGTGLSLTENAGYRTFHADTFTDVDSTDLVGGTLTFTVTSTPNAADDTLTLNTLGGIVNVTGGVNVFVSGVNVGTVSGIDSSGPMTITFNANATTADAQTLLQAFFIRNTSENPVAGTRTIEAIATDGDGGTSVAVSVDVDFIAVNDAPVLTVPAAQSTNKGDPLSFNVGANEISVTDVDATDLTVTLTAEDGTLDLGSVPAGLIFTTGDGADDFTMSFTGTIAEVNTALDGLTFTNSLNTDGTGSIDILLTDNGQSGSGGALTDSATIAITIVPPTPPPVVGDAFLQGNFVQVGLGADGAFGSDGNAPVGYALAGQQLALTSDPDKDGFGTYDGDFALPGSPEEGWGVQVAGVDYNNNNSILTPEISGTLQNLQTSASRESVDWAGSVAGLDVNQTYSVLANELYVDVVVSLTNTTLGDFTDVYFLRNVDPDNNQANGIADAFTTTNTIVSQGNDGSGQAVVTATQSDGSYLALVGFGDNARVTRGGFTNRSGADIFNGTATLLQSGSSTADEAISLAYNFSTIAAGETVTVNYRYYLGQDAVPQIDLDADNSSGITGSNFAAVFVEDGGPVAIADSDATLLDFDSSNLTGLTATITNIQDGAAEVLAVNTGSTGIVATYSAGTLTLTGPATVADYQSVLRTLTYENTSQSPSTVSRVVSLTVTDGVKTSAAATTTVSFTALNDAPVLTASGPSFTTIAEDDVANNGDTVASLLGSSMTDADASALQGIAVTGLNSSNGTWEFSTDGTSWTAVGTVSDNSALLLRSIDRLRFVPDGIDADSASVTYRAWDQTSGITSTKVDVSINGGTTAFSVGTDTAGITVTAVNDAPVLTAPLTTTVIEDTQTAIVGLSFVDIDDNGLPMSLRLDVSNGQVILDLSAGATITAGSNNSASVQINGTKAQLNNALASLEYLPNGDVQGTAADSLVVQISDLGNTGSGGLQNDTATVQIDITNVNDEEVVASNAGLTVNEGDIGVQISQAMLETTDVDHLAAQLTYTVTTLPTSGTLRLSGAALTPLTNTFTQQDINSGLLTYDHDDSEVFTDSFAFTVDDGTGTSQSGTFAITITPVNDNVPLITSDGGGPTASFVIAENQTAVTTVTATDADLPAQTLTYSLSGADAGRFSIGTTSGVLSFASAPDFETALDAGSDNGYDIVVTVSDGLGLTDQQTIHIDITDVDEFDVSPVTDSTSAANTVDENQAGGTFVGITAFSEDLDGTTSSITYSLDDNGGGLFTIDAVTGAVTTTASFDFEVVGPNHTIIVRATSADTSTATQAYTIAVNDLDEFDVTPIVDSDAAANNIDENVTVGTAVGITAFSEDLDGTTNTITYSLDDNAGGLFTIDSATGVITTAAAIDYETVGGSLNVVVRATSADTSTTTVGYTITVNDLDEFDVTPIVDNDSAADNIDENVAAGTAVGITAFSEDLDGTTNAITYSLDDNAGGLFTIDSTTGVVTTAAAIDYETVGSALNIVVRATSADTSTATQAYTITVNDLNDNAPVITPGQTFNVSEFATVGTSVGSALATDVDTVGALGSWSIFAGNSEGVFAIDSTTGEITVINTTSLNYESTPVYTLTLMVTDGITTSAPQTVLVSLTNENDAPIFTPSAFSIDENTDNGSGVGAILATDEDVGEVLTYSIMGPTGQPFIVNGRTGVISVADVTQLDYESTTGFSITVLVTDSGGLVDTQLVSISLNDINEAPVDLNLSGGSVNENSTTGTVVGHVIASDADAGDTASYTLTDDSGGRFSLDAVTGVITVSNGILLNFEADSLHGIVVRTVDSGGLTYDESFTITVNDVNEAPVAVDDSVTGKQLEALLGPAGILTANDFDVDGDSITVVLADAPVNGTLILNADGSFIYTPNGTYSGTDNFTYFVSDGSLNSGLATVEVTTQITLGGTAQGEPDEPSTTSPNTSTDTTPENETTKADIESQDETISQNSDAVLRVNASGTNKENKDGFEGIGISDPSLELLRKTSSEMFVAIFLDEVPEVEAVSIGNRSSRNALLRNESRISEPEFLFTQITSANPFFTGYAIKGDATTYVQAREEEVFREMLLDKVVVGSTAAVSTSVSVGYVVWMLRGGSLLTTFLSSLPAWQSFDPLPVLDSFEQEDTGDGETLASIVSS